MVKKTEQVYLRLQLNKIETPDVIESHINDWFWMGKILAGNEKLIYEELTNEVVKSFSETDFAKNMVAWSTSQEVHLSAKNKQLSCECYLKKGVLSQTIVLPFSHFIDVKIMLEDYVNQKMIQNGLYAYIRDYQEYLTNNLFYIDERLEALNEEIPNLRKMKNDEGETVIDCSQLAGYDLMYDKVCLTSCWKMWFSKAYYQLLPKLAFLEVQQVDEIKELANEVVQITLYESPIDWQLPVNLKFQSLFRKQLGFDQIEWINGVGVLEEPYTEFIKAKNMTQMIQYQNEYMQPTNKTTASHFISRLYNQADKLYLETRKKGCLNYQAYFPLEIKETKEMLVYWLLNTEYCLDSGIEALTYYIDYYLRALENLSNFDKKATVVHFYLPEKAFQQLPFDKLVDNLEEKKFLVYPSIVNYQYVMVKYGQSLSVIFSLANELQTDSKKWQQVQEKSDEKSEDNIEKRLKKYWKGIGVNKE